MKVLCLRLENGAVGERNGAFHQQDGNELFLMLTFLWLFSLI